MCKYYNAYTYTNFDFDELEKQKDFSLDNLPEVVNGWAVFKLQCKLIEKQPLWVLLSYTNRFLGIDNDRTVSFVFRKNMLCLEWSYE